MPDPLQASAERWQNDKTLTPAERTGAATLATEIAGARARARADYGPDMNNTAHTPIEIPSADYESAADPPGALPIFRWDVHSFDDAVFADDSNGYDEHGNIRPVPVAQGGE